MMEDGTEDRVTDRKVGVRGVEECAQQLENK